MYRTKLVLIFWIVIALDCRSTAAFGGDYLRGVDVEIHRCEHSLKPILINSPTYDDMFSACEIKVVDNPLGILRANMFSGLDGLLKLKFENSSTEEVQPHFLNMTPNIVTLTITKNNITTVREHVFSNTDIKYLRLNFNRITKIETEAFDNMTELVLLDLGYNFLKTIDGRWFRNVPNLSRISFVHNLLSEIGRDDLRNLRVGDYLTIILSYNRISEVHPKAFENLVEIRRLELQSNMIAWLPGEFFSKFRRLWQLNLNRNNISCVIEEDADVLLPVQNLFLKGNELDCGCIKKLQLFMKANSNYVQMDDWRRCFNYFEI